MHVFGSTIYAHNDNDAALGNRSFLAVWLGYGPSTAIILYWDKARNIYGRCHHACHDDYDFQTDGAPAQLLLERYVSKEDRPLPEPCINYEEINSPFAPYNCFTYSVTLPPSGPTGLHMSDDKDFGLPLITRMSSDRPF